MDALETLLRQDGAALVTMARCWLGSGPAAMDAIAEGVAMVASRGGSAVDRAGLREAILTVAIERLSGEPERGEEALADLLPTYDAEGRRITRASGEGVALDGALGASILRAAIPELPAPFRQTLLLVDMEGWRYSDAADALGVTVPVLKRRLHLARMAMTTLVQRRGQQAMAAA
jgi:DNA-directed RNA polymerase specialized sigma24 family protein